jgi:Sec-independent protein translocase protein TatA
MPRPDLTDIFVILFVVYLIFGAAKFPALGEWIGRRLPGGGANRKPSGR